MQSRVGGGAHGADVGLVEGAADLGAERKDVAAEAALEDEEDVAGVLEVVEQAADARRGVVLYRLLHAHLAREAQVVALVHDLFVVRL